jgi:hypothetical protein
MPRGPPRTVPALIHCGQVSDPVFLLGCFGPIYPASFGPTWSVGRRGGKPAVSRTSAPPCRFGGDHRWGQMCPENRGQGQRAKTDPAVQVG